MEELLPHRLDCAAPMWEAPQSCAPMWERQIPRRMVSVEFEDTAPTEGIPRRMVSVEVEDTAPAEKEVTPKVKRKKRREVIVNDWTNENLLIIDTFKNTIKNSSIVYGKRMERNDRNLQRVLVLSLVFSSLLTLGSGIAVALGAITSVNTWVIFGFNISLLIFSAILLVVGGLNQVYGWDTKVDKLATFVEKLNSFWLLLDTEIKLSAENRFNAKIFLARVTGQYTGLLSECENISKEEYDSAMESAASNV